MADLIDFTTGKIYRRSSESEASLADVGQGPATMPTAEQERRVNEENERWAVRMTRRRNKIRTFRCSMLVLGMLFGFLHWWWAMAAAVLIMLLAKRLVAK